MSELQTNLPRIKAWEDQCQAASDMGHTVMIATIEGDPGCRKSSGVQKILRNKKFHRDNAFHVTLPTKILRNDWAIKLNAAKKDHVTKKGTPASYIGTLEKTLAEGWWGSINVRDEDKFPKGHLALTALLNPASTHFIVLGDRYQSQWHDPDPECLLNDASIPGEMDYYSKESKMYLAGTWRFGPGIANFFNMPTFNGDRGGFHFSKTVPKNARDLSPFFPNKSVEYLEALFKDSLMLNASHVGARWKEEMMGRDVDTYSGSQGLSAGLTIFEVTSEVVGFSEYRLLYTSLTRSRDIIVVQNYLPDSRTSANLESNPVLGPLMKYASEYRIGFPVRIHKKWSINIKNILGPLPKDCEVFLHGKPDLLQNWDFVSDQYAPDQLTKFHDPDSQDIRGGYRLLRRLDRMDPAYEEAYNFKPYITGVKEVVLKEAHITEVSSYEPVLRTHLPLSSKPEFVEKANNDVIERFSRELSKKNLYSVQLPDEYQQRYDQSAIRERHVKTLLGSKAMRNKQFDLWIKTLDDDANPLKYKPECLNWGFDQKNSDEASFAAAMGLRICRSTYLDNVQEYERCDDYGSFLFEAFKKKMGWTEPFKFDQLLFETCEAEFQARRAERSQTDKKASLSRSDPEFQNMIFGKTQWKLKSTEMKNAKALQTIFTRSDEYLFKHGPFGVYMLKVWLQNKPESCYIHASATEFDLMQWVAKYDPRENYEDLDISDFDGSVKGGAMHFFVRLMAFMNLPQWIIDDYVTDKLTMHTRSFVIALMTLSGEIYTYLINTAFSIARESAKFDLPLDDPIMGSGDDIQRFIQRPINPNWHAFERFDWCVEKRNVSTRGSFCSYSIFKGYVWKDPVLLLRRLYGQVERGKFADVVDGYFLNFLTIYRLGDLQYNLMTEGELEASALLSDFFFHVHKETGSNRKVDWSKVRVEQPRPETDPSFFEKVIDSVITVVMANPEPISNAIVHSLYPGPKLNNYIHQTLLQ